MKTTTIYVKGMHCRSCEVLLEDALSEISDINQVTVNYTTGEVILSHKNILSLPAIHKVITKNGYSIWQEPKAWITKNYIVWGDVGMAILIVLTFWVILSTTGMTELIQFDINWSSWFWGMILVGLVAWLSSCMAVVGWVILSLSARWSQDHVQQTSRQKFKPQWYFHLGRLIGFALFGWLLGVIGSALQINDRWYMLLFVLVGIIMLLSGLQLTQLFPRISAYHIWFPKGMQKYINRRWKNKWLYIESTLAWSATFFLPCGFTIIAQAYAATTGNFWLWALTMFGFALWTLPWLLSIWWLTTLLKWRWWQAVFRLLWVLLVWFSYYNFSLAHNYFVALQHINPTIITQTIPDAEKPLVKISLTQDNRGYSPNRITIPKNSRIELTIDSQDQYTCASSFWIPSKDIRILLNPWDNIITFFTDNEDSIIFGCSMMMYKGEFIVE